MNMPYPIYWPQFYTATIYEWKHLLLQDKYKEIIIDSLKFLVTYKRIELNAFVIMSNHIHIIWKALSGFTPDDNQASFMKYTAQQMKRMLTNDDVVFLEEFKVDKYDRTYQLWKREPLGTELFTPAVLVQKLDYIHNNPVRAGLCKYPEKYYYSSAKFYETGVDDFGILTHYSGN